MLNIAILLTCFNRKAKTLAALNTLKEAIKIVEQNCKITVYLTDDGSTDGTSEAVALNFPEVKILLGTGTMYWAGGMRNSWNEALKGNYDGYLLLNDDTELFNNVFKVLIETHEYCLSNYKKGGIYIGSTQDKKTSKLSYGGNIFTNRNKGKYVKVIPNEKEPQKCELGNANIMYVDQSVIKEIGILSDGFVHGLADFDYTLKAIKKGIPVLVAPYYLGFCTNDHGDKYSKFVNSSLIERLKFLYNPIGLDFKSHLQYMKNNFPLRLPVVFFMGYFKVLFPMYYVKKILKR
ncbi:glycosyltransferase family 2 protein [Cellulophaga tyrosinoxydans]|uniref:Glycosyltransferase, GT2 family n=1 Tax=Cellulophaga tyrosinoxydans TaxID=504486 RepID=A0A1W2A2E3_9FLAO|nr:glycosyltransferase family 2 protein [Cellulophaga tyrosinoxydans]SMC54845.1 Glycosyltransferase, GT2 family [Cellulophaga tyrosinoxydans]